MAGWWMTASSLTIAKHSRCGRPFAQGQGKNFVCVHVWVHVGAISILFHFNWQLTLCSYMYCTVPLHFHQISIFLLSSPQTMGHLYKWSISACVIATIPTLTDALHLKSENHPSKSRDDESLQCCTVGKRWTGSTGREGVLLPPTPSLAQPSGPSPGL